MHHDETFWGNPRTWVGVAFVIFFLLFGRKLWAALAGMLDARANLVRAELDEAARLRRDAEAMLAEATAAREKALTDAKALLEAAKHEAERVAAAAAADAEAATKRRERMAVERIAAAEKAAIDDVRNTAAEVATAAARAVIATGLSAEADAALIDHAIASLPAALRAA
jgi:F-type H+-transporting ATPase subunit b